MSTLPMVGPQRPGPAAWWQLILAETRMVARDTSGLIVPLGLPVLILVMFGQGVDPTPVPGWGGLTALEGYVVPLTLTIVIATIGVINMPSFLAMYRKTGILRRLSVTPAHPAMVLAAQLVVSLMQTLVGVALALGVARALFDLTVPRRVWLALGVFALATAAMYALGLLVAALAPTPNSSVAIGMILFFGMGATGGLFGPTEQLPDAVAEVGETLPFGASVQVLRNAWMGQTPELVHAGGLALTALIAALIAAWRFRWD
jgi:ABC-2 type transport system permease protein